MVWSRTIFNGIKTLLSGIAEVRDSSVFALS